MSWFKKAFAVDPPGPAEPTSREQLPVDWVCIQIAKRHLTTPSLIFMEMSRPLNWIFAQTLHFSNPFVWSIVSKLDFEGYKQFSSFLERRGSMEYAMRRVEFFEEEFTRLEKQGIGLADYIRQHLDAARQAYADDGLPGVTPSGTVKDPNETD